MFAWAAVGASMAYASFGELSFLGCLGQLSGCTAVPTEFAGAVDIPKSLAVSPDGANVYSADEEASTVDVFSRNVVTGALTLTGCIGQHTGCEKTTPAKAVERPEAIGVSPDGTSVYAGSDGSNAVDEFSRNTSTGKLEFEGCIGQLSGCTSTSPGAAITGPTSIAFSANGASVYVASASASAVDEFSRDTSTGALTFEGCVGESGCRVPTKAHALYAAASVAVSPDGTSVYVGAEGGALSTFTRNTASGALTFAGCVGLLPECTKPKPEFAVQEPLSVIVSPDGANVYAGNFNIEVVDEFTREAATGALTFAGCVGHYTEEPAACTATPKGVPEGPLHIAISPDGADLYVASDYSVSEFARGPGGILSYAGCIGNVSGVCTVTNPTEAVFFQTALAFSPNGANLYSGDQLSHAVDVFGRQTQSTVGSPPSSTTSQQTPSSGSSETAAFTAFAAPLAGIATTPAAVEELLLGCSKRSLVLNDVLIRGSRVELEGSAAKSLDGKKVKILFDDSKQVSSATVGKNGQFSTTAPLPPASLRDSNDARYEAESGAQRSLDLKLTRRLSLEPPKVSDDTVTLVGQVAPPLTKPIARITVQQELECGRTTVVAHVTPSSSGRFRVTVTVPAAAKAGVYRLTSTVRDNTHSKQGFATYSLPLPAAFG